MDIQELDTFESEIVAALFGLCRDYRIAVDVLPPDAKTISGSTTVTAVEGITVSPLHSAFGIKTCHTLLIAKDAEPEPLAIFHEIVHIILGPESQSIDEGFVLISFQQQLAKYLARRLSKISAKSFLESVVDSDDEYELPVTPVLGRSLGIHVMKKGYGAWFRNGKTRARRLGVLDTRGQPTFKFADWTPFDAKDIAEKWCLQTDVAFMQWMK